MEGRNYLKTQFLAVAVWSVVPIIAIYKFFGWHGILTITLALNSRTVWRMMIERNPNYIYVLNIQMRVCNLSLFILLWHLVGQVLYPGMPKIIHANDIFGCAKVGMEIGDICHTSDPFLGLPNVTYTMGYNQWYFWKDGIWNAILIKL